MVYQSVWGVFVVDCPVDLDVLSVDKIVNAVIIGVVILIIVRYIGVK